MPRATAPARVTPLKKPKASKSIALAQDAPARAAAPSKSVAKRTRTSTRTYADERIEIWGAREHNLKIDHLELPKKQLVVFTGVSGSGKSSLAFDTLYAEGQRRYIESLSAYARQFLGQLDRPQVDKLSGLSPTIAIEQKSASGNPRSTVGTITEIYDYLRLLYARIGVQYCHICGKRVKGRTTDEIVREVLELPRGVRMLVLAPLVTHRKGEFRDLFQTLQTRGFARVRVNGTVHRLEAVPALDKKLKHNIELVVDRVTLEDSEHTRLAESVETALREGQGEVRLEDESGSREPLAFSEKRACCGISFPELTPQSFSFNSPLGLCSACNGLGTRMEVDPDLVIPDPSRSIRNGAIAPWRTSMEKGEGWTFRIIDAMAQACAVDLDMPFEKLPKKKRDQVLYGLGEKRIKVTWGAEGGDNAGSWGMRFEGILNSLMRRYRETSSEAMREHYTKFMSQRQCDSCGGKRLRPETLFVRIGDSSIADVTQLTVARAHAHIQAVALRPHERTIGEGALREIERRLSFLLNVGLDYLTLDRAGPSLSGGEAQRVRLATQLGSELSGVMYVLDEPSIGLHQRDNQRLIGTLERLRDLGNTVLVVEHDEDTIRAADHLVDFGPGAGVLGGQVLYSGVPADIVRAKNSITGQYLSGKKRIEVPGERRKPKGKITIRGAAEHNLQGIDVDLPLGCLVSVTGVSGAGKSSLINGILLPALERILHKANVRVGKHAGIEGLEALDKVIAIDQKPIGRTPRSNPGTYTKAFDEIREVFAQLPEARAKGFGPGRFSFNTKGGRCEACSGDGVVKVEMHFLADVYVPCEVCEGKRYDAQTLTVHYKGKSIADVLDTSIDDCLELFAAHPTLKRVLATLVEVGLGYVKIGQPATTLSGGEAQRVKLSRELGKRHTGKTLYILDEPTTGLHFADIHRLLYVLQKLADAGNTVLVIEHNLDVIKCSDWVIDLGPEGGERGGKLLVEGTPETVARAKNSHTGRFLAPLLAR
ncbi:MAG: excinuclease subunit [Myxococcaceae bacterium]|nr:excinuclease subunit [Myxococcaceae bacterium]